jgi:3-deoxy-D-manno-octulosonic-acid transferase
VWIVRRVLRRLRPGLVIVLETEIWPNLWREAKRSGASLLVVNGRLSDRAYPRYRRLSWFFAPLLSLPDEILAQSAVARDRYIELGAPAGRVRHAGNLKYDFAAGETPPPAPVVDLLRRLPEKPRVWIAASTMPPRRGGDIDEDEAVLAAFLALAPRHPRLLLIHVPRRPERFDAAARIFEAAGVPLVRRSRLHAAAFCCSTRWASWRLCSRWRTWCSWAARWPIAAGIISWSRPSRARPSL